MRILISLAVSLLLVLPAVGQQSATDQEHTKWIASVLESAATIRPGMIRSDLLKVFREEGGISSRQHRTYVYRQCPYIKVDVDFKLVGGQDPFRENPEDEIVKISRPYLAYSIMD